MTRKTPKPPCSSCGRKANHAKNLCSACYMAKYRRGTLDGFTPRIKREKVKCAQNLCQLTAKSRGFCAAHYADVRRNKPELLGIDPTTCMRVECEQPRYASGLCSEHYKAQTKAWNDKRRGTRPSRAKKKEIVWLAPIKEDNRHYVALGSKHGELGANNSEDFWSFVKRELSL